MPIKLFVVLLAPHYPHPPSHLDLFCSDMSFSQPTTITLSPVPSVFARLGRTVKTRVPIFKSCLPSLTMKGRKFFSKRKSPLVSVGAKRKYFLPPLRLPSSSSSYRSFRESTSSPTTVDSDTSNGSTSDIILMPSSPICVPVLLTPPPVGTRITDRFWPEEDPEHREAEVSLSGGLASPGMVNVLSPPPYHRRSPSTDVQQEDILSSDTHPLHYSDWQDDSLLPLRFPF